MRIGRPLVVSLGQRTLSKLPKLVKQNSSLNGSLRSPRYLTTTPFSTPSIALQQAAKQAFHTAIFSHPAAAMESLLSLSFDYLSSCDGGKIRKGLRQLEGLLAQICLSKSGGNMSVAQKRRSTASSMAKESRPKELAQLKDDAAFREFFKLQEGFEWNGKQCSRRYYLAES